jgi:hypothetical protein
MTILVPIPDAREGTLVEFFEAHEVLFSGRFEADRKTN